MSYFIPWHLFISFQMHYISDLSILCYPLQCKALVWTYRASTGHIPTFEFNKQPAHSLSVFSHLHRTESTVQIWSILVMWYQIFGRSTFSHSFKSYISFICSIDWWFIFMRPGADAQVPRAAVKHNEHTEKILVHNKPVQYSWSDPALKYRVGWQ